MLGITQLRQQLQSQLQLLQTKIQKVTITITITITLPKKKTQLQYLRYVTRLATLEFEPKFRIEYFIKPQQIYIYLESARLDLQNDVKIYVKYFYLVNKFK